MDLVQQVLRTIEHESLLQKGARILLGVSGGLDSTTLLYILRDIQKIVGFELGLAHINHSLRGEESERDEQFIKDLAQRFCLPVHINKADVRMYSLQKGLSIQHAGRELRYRYFNETADEHGYDKIAVAHNLDDQVETFLLRMLKGTGLRGLSAIPIKRDRIIRPLLLTYRAHIAEYARQNSIAYVEDSSNQKTIYERNFLRKQVVPLMEMLNPTCKDKLVSLLNDFAGINRFFEEKSQQFVGKNRKTRNGEIFIDIDKLNKIDDETRFRVVSDMLASLEPRFIPLREHFRQIQMLLSAKKPNLVSSLPFGIKAKRIYDRLIITKKPSYARIEETFSITMGNNTIDSFLLNLRLSHVRKVPVDFPKSKNVAFLDHDKLGNLTVRTFINGDRFVPLGMADMVKLKDFFISLKIPQEDRKLIPLLLSDGNIIWVVGFRIDERYRITSKTRKAIKVTATPFAHTC